MAVKLILVRHGETEWNKKLKFQGNKDIPLNQVGKKQANKLAARLANEKIDAIYSSDLDRAHQTAQMIAEEHDLEVESYPQLQEIDFGVWEGLTFEQIQAQYPQQFNAWEKNPEKNNPAQGENLTDVKNRVFKVIEDILEEQQDKTVLVAAHGGVNRVIISNLLEIPLSKCWRLQQDNTAVNIINIYQSEIILELFNSTYHLNDFGC